MTALRLVPPLTPEQRDRADLDALNALKARIAAASLQPLRRELEAALDSNRPEDWRDALILVVASLAS